MSASGSQCEKLRQPFSDMSTNIDTVGVFTERLSKDGLHSAIVAYCPDFPIGENTGRADTSSGQSQADKGSTVTIVVSSGPPQVSVPSLQGDTPGEASTALQAVGLTLGTQTTKPSTRAQGTIFAQDPTPDTKVAKGTAVNVTVSGGPAQVAVPDVVCESLSQAQSDIAARHLQSSVGGQQVNLQCPDPNKVASQDPRGGTLVNRGSTVQLFPSEASSPSPSPT